MTDNKWLLVLALFYLFSVVSSTNWLYNAPRTLFGLAGSASASASAASTPLSYITDLRKKEAKSAQLQKEKGAVGLEPLSGEEDMTETNDGNNEASPTLLQKKISKILTKLRLIAQIKNAYHYRPEDHVHDTDINFNITSVRTNDENNKTADSTEDVQTDNIKQSFNTRSKNIQQIAPTSSHEIAKHNPETDNKPTKVDLDVEKINGKLADFGIRKSEKIKEYEPSRLGALGVFFAELVGSIVGLTYGAVAQIASGGQSPVTISTSEGL